MNTGSPVEAALVQLANLQEQVAELAEARARDAAARRALSTALRRRTKQPGTAGAIKAIRTMRRRGPKGPAAKPQQGDSYVPHAAPRWWQLTGAERAREITRLRAWVETVFRPGYGHLAVQVGACWEQHDLCLYQLAWLSELHTLILYSPDRLLASEADWHLRMLRGAVDLMAAETASCDHLTRAQVDTLTMPDPWARTS